MIGNNDYTRTRNKPECIEREVRVVKAPLFRVMLECKEGRVDEHAPAYGSEDDEAIASNRLIDVQNLSRIEMNPFIDKQG